MKVSKGAYREPERWQPRVVDYMTKGLLLVDIWGFLGVPYNAKVRFKAKNVVVKFDFGKTFVISVEEKK